MAASPTSHRTALAALAGAGVLAIVGLIYWAGEDGTSGNERRARASAADVPQMVVTSQPLPADATTLSALLALASGHALQWREDALPTRLYATEVTRDGALDPNGSSVQIVFLSQGATSAGPPVMNGWRFSASNGKWNASEIMVQPPPDVALSSRTVCDLRAMVGQDSPERMTVDVRWAATAPGAPLLQAFSDKPEKWLLAADPDTCSVRMRSTRSTAQEQLAASASASAASPRHGAFDRAAAEALVDATIGRTQSCGRGDGGGFISAGLTFEKDGRVKQLVIEPAAMRGDPAVRCIADRLRRIQVAPWQSGDGNIVRRIPF